jgi:ACT domain-containing protein
LKLTEDTLRKLTIEAIKELGDKADSEQIKRVVEEHVRKLDLVPDEVKTSDVNSGKVILTSFGVNHPGIIYNITKLLSESECDIRDLSQKILDEFYTMIMIIDISNSPKELKEIQEEMNKVADSLKIKIYLQHEDVFRYMHRI